MVELEMKKCNICDKELKSHEVIIYSQGKWAGKFYLGSDYFELCKSCYKRLDRRRTKFIKYLGLIVLGIVLAIVVLSTIVFN